MFDGIEIDMLSLGDADAILVTQWNHLGSFTVLVDAGSATDADAVKDFLRCRNLKDLWAVVCTHTHNDHANGLIKIVRDKSITIHNGWMHDIRNHVIPDTLRRASAGNSSRADGVRQVVETTKELASAFATRGVTPHEPFAGACIARYPSMFVLSPSQPFYRTMLEEFTDVPVPALSFWSSLIAAGAPGAARIPTLAVPAGNPYAPVEPFFTSLSALTSRFPPPPPSNPYSSLGAMLMPLAGALKNSDLTGGFCTSRSEREFTLEGSWYADEEI